MILSFPVAIVVEHKKRKEKGVSLGCVWIPVQKTIAENGGPGSTVVPCLFIVWESGEMSIESWEQVKVILQPIDSENET